MTGSRWILNKEKKEREEKETFNLFKAEMHLLASRVAETARARSAAAHVGSASLLEKAMR